MSSRAIRLLLLILLVATVSFVFLLNPQPASVTYGSGKVWNAPMALILIVVFFLGVLISAFLSFFVGAQLSFSQWRERKFHRMQRDHMAHLVTVREYIAARRFDLARPALERMITQDPANIVVRIMLAQTLREMGEVRAALNVLDEARTTERRNLELLFLASEIHTELGNYTAALDNLALVLQSEPNNREALEQSVYAAAQLKRFDRAAELQAQLVKLSGSDRYEDAQMRFAELELEQIRTTDGDRAPKLEELLRRHRNFPAALGELAVIERGRSNFESAAKRLALAYRESSDVRYLESLARLWLEIDEPSKAVATVKAALPREITDTDLAGELFYILLLLSLGMNDEASAELRRTKVDLERLAAGEAKQQLLLLEARVLEREGKGDEAQSLLRGLVESRIKIPGSDLFVGSPRPSSYSRRTSIREQPSPRLSTP